jgi:hypothetical protein
VDQLCAPAGVRYWAMAGEADKVLPLYIIRGLQELHLEFNAT